MALIPGKCSLQEYIVSMHATLVPFRIGSYNVTGAGNKAECDANTNLTHTLMKRYIIVPIHLIF